MPHEEITMRFLLHAVFLEYEVEEILDSQRKRRRWKERLEYMVHWKDYDFTKRTWELAAAKLIDAAHKVAIPHQKCQRSLLLEFVLELVAREEVISDHIAISIFRCKP